MESGIRRLYHYEKFEAGNLEDTPVNQRVHFSNPKNFNDPWDCYPCFDTTRVADPGCRARCIREALQLSPAQPERYEAKLQGDKKLFAEVLQTEFRDAVRNVIIKRWRIYCLTPHSDNRLMWSHYSDKHRGICLEFDAGEAVIGGAYQVAYSDAPPALDILAISDPSVFQILVTKSPDWCYENEYRILARDGVADDVPPQFLPITDKDFLLPPPHALTAIIAGCRANIDKIKALVQKHAPGLPVKQAVQAPDRYSLSIKD